MYVYIPTYYKSTSIKNSKLPAKEKNILHLLYIKKPHKNSKPSIAVSLSLPFPIYFDFNYSDFQFLFDFSYFDLTFTQKRNRTLFFFVKRKLID
jgi:hypothetical protein